MFHIIRMPRVQNTLTAAIIGMFGPARAILAIWQSTMQCYPGDAPAAATAAKEDKAQAAARGLMVLLKILLPSLDSSNLFVQALDRLRIIFS